MKLFVLGQPTSIAFWMSWASPSGRKALLATSRMLWCYPSWRLVAFARKHYHSGSFDSGSNQEEAAWRLSADVFKDISDRSIYPLCDKLLQSPHAQERTIFLSGAGW